MPQVGLYGRSRGSSLLPVWKRRVGRSVACGLLVALVGAGVAEGHATRTVIRTSENQMYGRIVVGPTRYTVYLFCSGSALNCNGHPSPDSFRPLIAHGALVTTPWSQIKPSKLETRRMYIYKGDRRPGQTNGDHRYQGSGAWFVITPDGEPPVPEM